MTTTAQTCSLRLLAKMRFHMLPALACLVLALAAGPVLAQQKFVRGQATDVGEEAALKKAKLAAWRNYLGTVSSPPRLSNITANEKAFLDAIDEVVIDVTVVEKKCEGAFRPTCTIAIKATVSENLVDDRLRRLAQGPGAPGSGPARVSAQDDIAFLVVARVADSQTSFDVRTTRRAESTVGTSGSAASADASSSNRAGSAESSADAVSVTQTSRTVTGGSQEAKRDRIKYAPWPNIADLQNRVGEAMSNARFAMVPWEDLVSNCGVPDSTPFSRQYADSEDGQIPAAARNEIFRKLRECQVTKIVIASIDVDSYRTDPNTGLWLASGNMNLQAFDISGRFGRSIGSANRNIAGRGEKITDAGRNALASAARAAAEVVVNQFNMR
jgi:hypothetical protein